ncbi:MAG TPA: AMP-binding protein, partial [Casimicrobiaceae bacterium]|nr:AMP-binding protein [Casimicrobiaceae bacterium]
MDRYEQICASFRWEVPADFNIAQACCGRWASDRARFALYWEDEDGARQAWTFFDLREHANRLSNALQALGVGRGDKVAIVLPQRPETVVAHVAINQLGAVAVPLSFLFGADALQYRLENSETKAVLVDPQSLPNLTPIRDALAHLRHVIGVAGACGDGVMPFESLLAKASRHFEPAPTRARDPALLVYTSGTTGPPKGALMPQCCLIGNLPGFVHSHDGYPQEGDLFWS